MADRIVLMDGGRIRQVGAPMELYHRPADLFVATFLGAPAMNIWAGHVSHDARGACFEIGGISIALPQGTDCRPGPASLGFRPEDVSISARPGALGLRAHLVHVERLGAETLVQFSVEGLTGPEINARLPGTLDLEAGTAALFHVPASALHLFGSDGRAVALPERMPIPAPDLRAAI